MLTDDYIKRSDAINALNEAAMLRNLDSVEDGTAHRYKRAVERIIAGVPAADVEPVRYAEWISPDGLSICSNCGKAAPYDVQADIIMYWPNLNFCPNCGCRMNAETTKGEDDGKVH